MNSFFALSPNALWPVQCVFCGIDCIYIVIWIYYYNPCVRLTLAIQSFYICE